MIKETSLARSVRLICAAGMATLIAAPAFAQEADAPIQRVQITGSAIKRIDAETSVPVTIVKVEDLKKQGITTIEQVMSSISAVQSSTGTSQSVGSSTGGASFADLRGIGANKTLILLNGRRLANNALDSSAPDLNMIPFAALERVEVLRDGASSLYGSDAVGGVINFITRKDFTGGTVTVGYDSPQHDGGQSKNINIGGGYGDLDKDGFNVFAVLDHQRQRAIQGTERNFNTRYAGGLSSSTSPANYYQGDNSVNPSAGCADQYLISDGNGGCYMTTSSFVDYVPKNERTSGLVKATLKLSENHQLNLEYLGSRSKISTAIAPEPYGGLYQNRLRPDGTLNPYYPGNGGTADGLGLDPNYTEANTPDGVNPGFAHVKWRALPNGARADENVNRQNRFVASLSGVVKGWDYQVGLAYNENKVTQNIHGYANGDIITDGVLNGIINPYGDQDAAGTALLEGSRLSGTLQTARGTTKTIDFQASREFGDWFNAGNNAGFAFGGQASRENFHSAANTEFAEKVVASTGIDPNLRADGSRTVYALYGELNVPVLKTLDVTAAVRYDKYSDFGNTTNPKLGFRWQPRADLMVRGSASSGFRAPSLYDLYQGVAYTNSAGTWDDPVNCPGGTPLPGKSSAANCSQQFQVMNGGNRNLQPEKSRNFNVGVVWEPVKDLTLGADLWAIKLRSQINSLAESDAFGNEQFVDKFHRSPSGDLSVDGSQCPNPLTCGYIDLRTENLGDLKTNGIDVNATYRYRAGAYGNFTLSTNGTWVHEYKYQNFPGDEYHQNVGAFVGTGAVFRWQDTTSLVWNLRDYTAGVTAHYKTGYQDAANDYVPDNKVSSYTTFDSYVSWKAYAGLTLTAGARNMFDREPPISYQEQTFQAGYDPRYADAIGRTYYVRATYNF